MYGALATTMFYNVTVSYRVGWRVKGQQDYMLSMSCVQLALTGEKENDFKMSATIAHLLVPVDVHKS